MSFSKILWVDTADKQLVKNSFTKSQAYKPIFTQGDTVPLEIILLEDIGGNGTPFRNITIGSETLKVALGRVDQAATSGTFTLAFDGDTTSA